MGPLTFLFAMVVPVAVWGAFFVQTPSTTASALRKPRSAWIGGAPVGGRTSRRLLPLRGASPATEPMFGRRAVEDTTTPVSFDLLLR